MGRGQLRLYLGAAPGVGKTFAMLNEGRRRRDRGTDVVVALVETHGRPLTTEQVGDLEVVPRRTVDYRGASFDEMDLAAVLARSPEVALVDELAHSNVPGVEHEKRWEDVEALLDAGIDVISTLNIQHLESVNDVVERITGVEQRERIPDAIVRRADQIELVDMTPEALRRRMAHGNVYAPEKIDTALSHYFRVGNLSALRELALLWVADRVDEGLADYRSRHGITAPWETRERVLVAITGAPGADALIRRAARTAERLRADLLGVHVRTDDGLTAAASDVAPHRDLLEALGGEFHEVVGADAARTLTEFARAQNCTQILLGSSRRSHLDELVRGSIINRVIRLSAGVDVHVISPEEPAERTAPARRRPSRSPLPPRRRLAAWLLAAIMLPVLTLLLDLRPGDTALSTVLLLYVLLAVIVAAIGGPIPAIVTAIGGFLCANWFFTPPVHTFTVGNRENLLTLLAFVMVTAIVSAFVDVAARRTRDAARARAEAETLARISASIDEDDPLQALVDAATAAFSLDGAALLVGTGTEWTAVARSGAEPPADPSAADVVEPVGDDAVLAVRGSSLQVGERRVLAVFARQLRVTRDRATLAEAAAAAHELSEANELRTALLQAVSHDLRTPLAAIKAAASSLRQPDVDWGPDDEAEFLATIEDQTDRLTVLVTNLLDMSRLQVGALAPRADPVHLEDVMAGVLTGLGDARDRVDVTDLSTAPPVSADAALLERALANIVENAVRFSPPGRTVRIDAGGAGEEVRLRVADHGPGIPAAQRERVFEPFQRLDDRSGGNVGLGLAVAHGFVVAMGGTLELEDTPGGGTTVVVSLVPA